MVWVQVLTERKRAAKQAKEWEAFLDRVRRYLAVLAVVLRGHKRLEYACGVEQRSQLHLELASGSWSPSSWSLLLLVSFVSSQLLAIRKKSRTGCRSVPHIRVNGLSPTSRTPHPLICYLQRQASIKRPAEAGGGQVSRTWANQFQVRVDEQYPPSRPLLFLVACACLYVHFFVVVFAISVFVNEI